MIWNFRSIWVMHLVFSLTICSYHVTYAFQSESKLYSYLNVKELLTRSRRKVWSLSDYNWTWTHNHLAHKRTLNHLAKLAKWLSVWLNSWVFVYKLSGCGFAFSCSHLKFSIFIFVSSKMIIIISFPTSLVYESFHYNLLFLMMFHKHIFNCNRQVFTFCYHCYCLV